MASVSTVALFLSWSRLLAALLPVSAAVSAGDPHVHVVSTICGKDYVAKTMPMLRSLLWHRTSPLTLHIIADRPGAYSSCPGLHPRLCIAVCAARVQLQKVFGNGWYANVRAKCCFHNMSHDARVQGCTALGGGLYRG